MMIQQTLDKLYAMKLDGMADSLKEQIASSNLSELSFEDRISLIVDRQWDLKKSRGLRRRLQVARLRQQAAVEDIDFRSHRGLDKSVILGCGDLLQATSIARADGSYQSLMRRLEKTDLLVIDDWGLYPLDADASRDVFEILEARTGRGSVIVVSQVPVEDWQASSPFQRSPTRSWTGWSTMPTGYRWKANR